MKQIIPTLLCTLFTTILFAQTSVVKSTPSTQGAVSSSYAAPGKTVKPAPPATKQTQGMSFGEKVAQGLNSAGSAMQQGASDVIITRNPLFESSGQAGVNPMSANRTYMPDSLQTASKDTTKRKALR